MLTQYALYLLSHLPSPRQTSTLHHVDNKVFLKDLEKKETKMASQIYKKLIILTYIKKY